MLQAHWATGLSPSKRIGERGCVNPLTQVSSLLTRGTVFKTVAPVLTGRWVQLDATNKVVDNGTVPVVDPAKAGSLFIWEGTRGFSGTTRAELSDADKFFNLPAASANGACTAIYGVFRCEVGPEGFEAAVVGQPTGTKLQLTAAGTLDVASSGNVVAVVDAVSATKLTFTSIA
jgi:hypothetical protein